MAETDWVKEILNEPSPPKQEKEVDWVKAIFEDAEPSNIGGTKEQEPTPVPPVPKAESTSMEWRDVFSQALKNAPSSAVGVGENIISPVVHPVETGKAIGGMVAGAFQKLIPESARIPGELTGEYEKNIDALVDFFKGRYGTIDNFKQTVAKDPVGVLADISTLLMAGGGAVKTAGAISKVSQLEKTGDVISKVGAVAEPFNVAKRVASVPFKFIPESVPTKMYLSGAKFSTLLSRDQRVHLAKTGLINEIAPSLSGLDKLRDKIEGLNSKIDSMIDDAVTTGNKMDVNDLFSHFNELKKDYLENTGKPITSLKSIESVEKQITEANQKLDRTNLSPREVQDLKKGIYRELEKEYAKIKNHPASVDAQMAVARSAKEYLEGIIPEIKQLNATEGELINLRKHIERSASRISNRDLMGIGVPIKGTMGGVVGGAGGAAAALALGVLDTPLVKANIAIVVNRLRSKGIKLHPTAALSRLTALKASEVRDAYKEALLDEKVNQGE